MLPPRPTTAINCEDGRRRHFARMSEMRSSLGLVKASKWTPDFAERYREKLKSMNGIRSTSGDVRRFQNVRGGRQ